MQVYELQQEYYVFCRVYVLCTGCVICVMIYLILHNNTPHNIKVNANSEKVSFVIFLIRK